MDPQALDHICEPLHWGNNTPGFLIPLIGYSWVWETESGFWILQGDAYLQKASIPGLEGGRWIQENSGECYQAHFQLRLNYIKQTAPILLNRTFNLYSQESYLIFQLVWHFDWNQRCYFLPKSTLWAFVTLWIYTALNRRIKKTKMAINKESKKPSRIFRSTKETLGFFHGAHSSSKNSLVFLCVISVMLDALRFKSINNKVNDYHMRPVINLVFLPWRKLGCSFLHWSSNSSFSQTKFWTRIAKPFQYGILWERKPWQLSHLAVSKLGRQPLPTVGHHNMSQTPALWLHFWSTSRTKLAQSVSVLL